MSVPELPSPDSAEWLSRCVDQDTDRHQTAAVLARLAEDREWRDRWARYHLIGDVLRGESIIVAPPAALAARIAAQQAREPLGQAVPRVGGSRRRGALAGVALAATVAAVVILPRAFAPLSGNVGTEPAVPLASAERGAACAMRAVGWATPERAAPFAPAGDPPMRTLERLIVEHRESAATATFTGFVPYVTVIANDVSR